MLVEKHISQLAVGSFVVDIVEQHGKVKVKSPGWVRDFHAIDSLIKQGVDRVAIDPDKVWIDGETAPRVQPLNQGKSVRKIQREILRDSVSQPSQPFVEQFYHAQTVFHEARNVQIQILDAVHHGKAPDIKAVRSIAEDYLASIFENPDALACVINIRIKDEYLLEHSIAVSILVSIFGHFLRLNRLLIRELAVGAFLHDVGKIKIPDRILNKPAKLSASEYELMKQHVVHSTEIADRTEGLSPISRTVIANHHEKLNGQGYPQGLGGNQLDRYSQMVAVCDIYDALTADRVYKNGMPQVAAFASLRQLAQQGEFDLSLVDRFIKCMGVYPVGSLVKLTSERLAMVQRNHKKEPCRPLVREFFSIRQNAFIPVVELDLAEDRTHKIEKAVRAEDFALDRNKVTDFLMMQA